MDLTITAKNLILDDDIEKYARKRLSRLDRRLRRPVPARLVVRRENAKRADQRYVAEVTADLKGGFLRGEERAATVQAAIDKVTDVLEGQISRYKTRRTRRGEGLSEFEEQIVDQLADVEGFEDLPEMMEDGRIVREKRHPLTPMKVSEAAAQMDLLGHGFYLFLNVESKAVNVVYRRHDGDYGLIVPE